MSRREGVALLAGALTCGWMAVTACRPRQAPPPSVDQPVAVSSSGTVPIVLFFVAEDGRLQRESREVPELPPVPAARVRLVLDELLAGSHTGLASPVPWAVTVQTVFVDRAGTAFVDFSAPPQPSIAGTSAELAFVYAVVNSVVANGGGISRVQLLFGGKEVTTFGNVDLSRPLPPGLDIVVP